MATTAYTIYSHYDPADRERLERETGQIQDSAEAWETEANIAFKRRLAPPPRFVPASGAGSVASVPQPAPKQAEDVAGWYRSLTRGGSLPLECRPSTYPDTPVRAVPRPVEKRSKNNWFIMNAIASEPPPAAAAPSSLADILARDPPPLPHEKQYAPPVWLALGPANKGFSMLQNSGWREGEALGHNSARQPKAFRMQEDGADDKSSQDVIDLTISDSEMSDEEESTARDIVDQNLTAATSMNSEGSSRKALVTPLGVVLKSDRLGIGLKAKTVGPFKASQKRITPNAAALAAHAKASEELRKQRKRDGKGRRGFTRRRKAEEANRRALLAYMNH
ncbi:hypothetical protein GGX14DRAFT_361852 [Mycena pura]|uniref:G-patch domain-containing protein n=1 Tax=Mycena pura TaxID=153505 RepID=A0AAD6VGD2_9AGAR|nr:hypothetical protein GGX14DRAFT_361852 [Mycena pura]